MNFMLEYIKKELSAIGIDTVGALPFNRCNVIKAHKLTQKGLADSMPLNVIIFTIPYYTDHKEKNISSYAIPRDYHFFCKSLSDYLLPRLKQKFEGYSFCLFSDDSPIDERDAAAKAGLGVYGDNGLLITKKYSSYVFLAELITDLPIKTEEFEIKRCIGCGACRNACPINDIGVCLSLLTQKKGELTLEESHAIKKYGCAWGCDICQEACPHTVKAKNEGTIYTDIDFFKEDLTPTLTSNLIKNMSEEEFSARAYSWRKKETILRNLKILEE